MSSDEKVKREREVNNKSINSPNKFSLSNLLTRYILLILLGLGPFFLIYKIFTPLTVYPVYYVLNLFYNATLSETNILINSHTIKIIPACIAGSAYYLLLVLNLTTKMNIRKRIYSIIYSTLLLLILNITRIIILSVFFINSLSFFDLTHKVFWYGLSTVFVVAIWFSQVKIFNIKNIPIYSDLNGLIRMRSK